MKFRHTAIALGVGAATAVGLSLLKVDKPVVIGSTAVVVGTGLMIARRDSKDESIPNKPLTGEKLINKVKELDDISKEDLMRACGYVTINEEGVENLNSTGFYEALLEAKGVCLEAEESEVDIGEPFDPKEAHCYYERGYKIFWETTKDPQDAIDDFTKAIELNYHSIENAYWRRGCCKAALDDYQGAINDYNMALDLDPVYSVYGMRADSKNKIGDHKGAIDDCTKAIELCPDELGPEEYYINRGVYKKELGDLKGACEDWKAANSRLKTEIKKKPWYKPSYAKGLVELLKENCEIGAEILVDIDYQSDEDEYNLDINEGVQYQFYSSGYEKLESEDYQGAIVDLTKALSINAEKSDIYIQALYNLAVAKYGLRDYQGAIDDLTKVLSLNAEKSDRDVDIDILYALASSKIGLEDYQGAILYFTKLIDENGSAEHPAIVCAFKDRGDLRFNLGDLKGACEDWKKAAELGDEEAAELFKEHCE